MEEAWLEAKVLSAANSFAEPGYGIKSRGSGFNRM
jgi:hypothetical protein